MDRPCLLVNQPRGDWYPAASNARLTSSSVNWVWGGIESSLDLAVCLKPFAITVLTFGIAVTGHN